MAFERAQVAKREILWLTRKMTTRDSIYVLGSFAIYSLRFFLHFFANGVFSVKSFRQVEFPGSRWEAIIASYPTLRLGLDL
jgi:hypothetical protein